MTTLEHVYAIKNLLSHGPASDDFNYSDRLIAHFLQISRSRLIEQKANRYNFISEQSYQDLCLTLALSSYHNCCNELTDSCKVMKSVMELPKFLNTRWGNFIRVTDLEGNIISEITPNQAKYSKHSLSKSQTGWFINNNHLYIVNNVYLTKVLLNGLFDNPDSIHEKNCSTTTPGATCSTFMGEEFPIDTDLVASMYEMTIKFLTLPSLNDIENNARDVQTVQGVQ